MIQVNASIISNWRELIQSGNGNKLKSELQSLELKHIKREFLAAVGNLARRVNLPHLSVRVLHHVVRPAFGESDASGEERCEYAAALAAIGAYSEAQSILGSVESGYPPALLFRAFTHIYSWSYSDAIPLLRKFLVADGSNYQKMVADTNLISALINTGALIEADERLGKLQDQVLASNLQLLYGNLLELKAQIAIRQFNYSLAKDLLNESESILRQTGNVSIAYTKKWRAVIAARSDVSQVHLIDEAKIVGKDLCDWETVRDCDLQRSLVLRDHRLFTQVYYGTPHAKYREVILPQFPEPKEIPQEYLLHRQASGQSWPLSLDLHSGELRGAVEPLKPNQLLHRFLKILCSDLYRPILVGTLFSKLFPKNHFNPDTSPDRVYQCIRRARQWCEKNKFILHIDSVADGYLFRLRGPCTIRYCKDFLQQDLNKSLNQERLYLLRDKFKDQTFTARHASEVLVLPLRSTNRFVKEIVEEGLLEQSGKGPNTKYKLVG